MDQEQTKAICLITIHPNKIGLDFLASFQKYDIYIMLDNLEIDITYYEEIYPNIHFIQVKNEDCKNHGYIHSSYMPTSAMHFNEIISWDRALFYFTNVCKKYEHIWFIEDDVFFYDETVLLSIDQKHPDADIVCKDKNPEPGPGEWGWFWPVITIHFPPPYFHSPICAVRMSRTLLFHIDEYIQENKKLFFIEALFPSIAHKQGLKYERCIELEPLYWRRDWKREEFDKIQIFHPIKDMQEQANIRNDLFLA